MQQAKCSFKIKVKNPARAKQELVEERPAPLVMRHTLCQHHCMLFKSEIIITAVLGVIVVGTVAYRVLNERRVESVAPLSETSPVVTVSVPVETQKTAVDIIVPTPAPTETIQTSAVMSPKETYIKMTAKNGNIKTFADIEAFTLKYGSKAQIASFRSVWDTATEAQKEQEAFFERSSNNIDIVAIKESINGSTATLSVSTKTSPTFIVTFVLENNQWKFEDRSSRL